MPIATMPALSAKGTPNFRAALVSPSGWDRPAKSRLHVALGLCLLTLLAVAIDGYHPYSEDAGIYVAGIKQLANSGMYASSGVFLEPYVSLSVFSRCGGWMVRAFHLPLEGLLFTFHLLTTGMLLYGCFCLARCLFKTPEGQWGAVTLVALCLSIPAAGTSLSLADPYLTGRSFSTPFTLFAACAILEKKLWRSALLLALTLLFHPLMGAYAVALCLTLWAVGRRSLLPLLAVTAGALATAATHYLSGPVPESAAYRIAATTRTYFFLSHWQWYEIVGLAAPLCILLAAIANVPANRRRDSALVTFAGAGIITGVIAICISLLFCQPSAHSYAIARLQPLRCFLFVYYILFLLLGAFIANVVLKRAPLRWAALCLLLGLPLGYLQKQVYPVSAQIELPGRTSDNSWHQAFHWIRANTPLDAIVALDAQYITAPGEDALGFRAVAERDALADQSKDGGAAAVFPQLANRWLAEQTLTTGLNKMPDAERRRNLAPLHVSWLVLDGVAVTALPCPFQSHLVKVCQLQ